MTSARIINFPIRRPFPTGDRQHTRQCVADRRAPLTPSSARRGTYTEAKPGGPDKARQARMEGKAMHQPGESPGTFSKWLGQMHGKSRHAHESRKHGPVSAGVRAEQNRPQMPLPWIVRPLFSGRMERKPSCRSGARPARSNLFRCPLGSTAVAGLVLPFASPATSNPPPASAVDDIVAAWLATLSEAS